MSRRTLRFVGLMLLSSACQLKVSTGSDAVSLQIAAPANVDAGQTFSITVTALDSTGQAATDYAGTIAFTSNDSSATLPNNYTFSDDDAGSKTFTNQLTLNNVGNQNIIVSDIDNSELATTVSVNVSAGTKYCVEFGQAHTVYQGSGMSTDAPIKDLRLDSPGNPWLAYQSSSGSGTWVLMDSYTGGAWAGPSQVDTSISLQQSPQLAISGVTASVALADGNPGTGATNQHVFYAYDAAGTWTANGDSLSSTGLSGDTSSITNISVALALDSSGNPWVVWDQDSPFQLSMLHWDGSQWASTGSGAVFESTALHPSLVLDSSDVPFVAWADNSDQNLFTIQAAYYRSGAWTSLNAVSTNTGSADNPSLVMDQTGAPVVAWDAYSGSVLNVYVARYSFTNNAWEGLAGSDSGNGVSNVTNHGAQHPSLAADSSGNVVLAWEDLATGQVFMKHFDGTAWQDMGGSSSGNGVSNTGANAARWPIVRLDASDHAVVAWEELSNGTYTVHTCSWQ